MHMFEIQVEHITDNKPEGKLADVTLKFTNGDFRGFTLEGFGVWKARTGNGENVTFPARTYMSNGQRKTFVLLRTQDGDKDGQEAQAWLREEILKAWKATPPPAPKPQEPAPPAQEPATSTRSRR